MLAVMLAVAFRRTPNDCCLALRSLETITVSREFVVKGRRSLMTTHLLPYNIWAYCLAVFLNQKTSDALSPECLVSNLNRPLSSSSLPG
jgi:hypothetical protein